MTAEQFSHVLGGIRPFTDYIYLHVQGEPMLHRQFDEILTLCDQAHIQVQLVTNGTLIGRTDLLSHPSLRKVSFSVQSIEYQKSVDPVAYMDTILDFCTRASQADRPYCEIRFWRDDQFASPATKRAYSYIIERFRPEETERHNSFRLMNHVYLSLSNSFDWPSEDTAEESSHGYCLGSLKQLAVLSDGTVVPCCLDANGVISFGNLFNESMDTILYSPRFLAMRENMQKRILSEELCRKCTYRRRFGQ